MTRECNLLCVDSESHRLGLEEQDEIWLPMMVDFKEVSVIRQRNEEEETAILYMKGIDDYFITDIPYKEAINLKLES